MNPHKRPKKTTKFMVRIKALLEELYGVISDVKSTHGFSNLLI